MDALNFRVLRGRDDREANYRLRGEPVKLVATITPVLECQGSDAWEDDGGAVAGLPTQVDVAERHRAEVRVRPPRKQAAARAAIPRETVRIVRGEAPAPIEVVEARVAGKSEADVQVARLEARIRELMGVVEERRTLTQRRKESLALLERMFERRRLK